jgi:hypothetical protein
MYKACNNMTEIRNFYKILFGKHKRKRPLGIFEYILDDNIKTDIIKISFGECGLVSSGSG